MISQISAASPHSVFVVENGNLYRYCLDKRGRWHRDVLSDNMRSVELKDKADERSREEIDGDNEILRKAEARGRSYTNGFFMGET